MPGKSCCSRFLRWLCIHVKAPKALLKWQPASLRTAATEGYNTVIQENCCNSLHVWFLELSVEMLHLCLPICTARFGKTTCQNFSFALSPSSPLGPYPSFPSSSPLSSETLGRKKGPIQDCCFFCFTSDYPGGRWTLSSSHSARQGPHGLQNSTDLACNGSRMTPKEKDYVIF